MKELNETLAMEMLRELKANAKRWFVISIIELVVLVFTIGIFIVYLNTPEEEVVEETSYSQDADTEGDYSPINQTIGEWYKWQKPSKKRR